MLNKYLKFCNFQLIVIYLYLFLLAFCAPKHYEGLNFTLVYSCDNTTLILRQYDNLYELYNKDSSYSILGQYTLSDNHIVLKPRFILKINDSKELALSIEDYNSIYCSSIESNFSNKKNSIIINNKRLRRRTYSTKNHCVYINPYSLQTHVIIILRDNHVFEYRYSTIHGESIFGIWRVHNNDTLSLTPFFSFCTNKKNDIIIDSLSKNKAEIYEKTTKAFKISGDSLITIYNRDTSKLKLTINDIITNELSLEDLFELDCYFHKDDIFIKQRRNKK